MENKEKYTVHKTTRLTPTQSKKLDELGVNIRDTVNYYIARMENPQYKLVDKKRELETKINDMEKEIRKYKFELEEINKELGVTKELEETYKLDIILDGNKIIESFNYHNTNGKSNIEDYFNTKQCKRMLGHLVGQNGGKNPNEYKENLLNYIRDNV